ncbi:response regulator transcription factor [Asticcacaulis sp. 201]|uniref:response regulator transcription factor n=1 Tax=Asticcacaulis sp. 201 TaxID=3028787 RepID=UPI002915ED74|nr:response regulator [Asticcacaulis sp. 201]MDV6330791.1 response regulator [Asticcacaulis sp. 201]
MSHTPVIAIIDDDEDVRSATENLVLSLNLKAITFASAEDFLALADLDAVACVITDVQMREMSGIDLQAYLQAEKRSLPMIFMTAFDDPKIRQIAEMAGAIGFLAKPCDGTTMISLIERAITAG